MRVLGIDPGVATIGFGLVEVDRSRQTLLRYGVITTPAGLPLSRRLLQISEDMEELLRLNVKIIQISYPYGERNFYMATLKDRYLPPVVQRFKQFVITHCRV